MGRNISSPSITPGNIEPSEFFNEKVLRYWKLGTRSLPRRPYDPLILSRLMKDIFSVKKSSSESTHPTPTPGKKPKRFSFGKRCDPSTLQLKSSRYFSAKLYDSLPKTFLRATS